MKSGIPLLTTNTGYKNHSNKKRNEKNLLQPTETTLKQKEAAKMKDETWLFWAAAGKVNEMEME